MLLEPRILHRPDLAWLDLARFGGQPLPGGEVLGLALLGQLKNARFLRRELGLSPLHRLLGLVAKLLLGQPVQLAEGLLGPLLGGTRRPEGALDALETLARGPPALLTLPVGSLAAPLKDVNASLDPLRGEGCSRHGSPRSRMAGLSCPWTTLRKRAFLRS